MKTLTTLALIQLAVSIFLLVKVGQLDHTVAPPPTAQPTESSISSGYAPDRGQRDSTAPFPEERLRKIVREELAAQLKSVERPAAEVMPEPAPADDAGYQYQRDFVAQRLEYYASVGQISDVEMAKLQGQIARLHKDDSREMMQKLVRMLNTGAIDGRL